METVKAAKSFIEAELAKYGTWDEFRSSICRGTILQMIDNGQSFAKVKGAGPGIETIQAFLGWKSKTKIEDTLKVIKVNEETLKSRILRTRGSNEPGPANPATTPKSVATSGYKPKPQEVAKRVEALVAEWVELTGTDTACVSLGGRGNEDGLRRASRDLGLNREDVRRATKVASLSPEARHDDGTILRCPPLGDAVF